METQNKELIDDLSEEEIPEKEDSNLAGNPPVSRVKNDNEENLCLICMSIEPDSVFLPCRHLCLCKECIMHLDKRSQKVDCPVCRVVCEKVVHIPNLNK